MFITAVFTMPKFESKQEAIQQVKGKTNCGARVLSCFSRARLFATLWTVAHQAPLSIGFTRREYWSEWIAVSSSRGSSQPRDRICFSCVVGVFFTARPPTRPINGLNRDKKYQDEMGNWVHS